MEDINRRDFFRFLVYGGALSILGDGCRRKRSSATKVFESVKPTALRILLIGIDGATLDIIEPMVKAGRLSQFKRLMEQGTYARLRSQTPMFSPALWTTIATGHNRDRHNITHFLSHESYGSEMPELISAVDRKTLALWNIVSAFKKTVGVNGWWVTWPAEPLRGKLVSDRVAHSRWKTWTNSRANTNLTYPSKLFEQIKRLIVDPTHPPMEEIEALVQLTELERSEILAAKKPIFAHGLSVSKFGYCAQRTYENIALDMLEQEQNDLNMIFLIAIDPICHTFWHYYRPEQFPRGVDLSKANRLGKFIPAIYEHNDIYLADLLSKIHSNTVVIVVSDHGFQGSGRLPGKMGMVDYRPLGINRVEKLVRPVTVGMSGIHHIDGTLIASGGPIIPGAKFKVQPSIVDITPTILALMGLPVGKDMAGRVLKEIIDPKFITNHPITYIDSYENYIERHQYVESVSADEDVQLDYLRSIGYVE
ncbi:MAG: alkaline phosphatase family protein [Planctomycetota bacterium]